LNGVCFYYLGKQPMINTLMPAFKIVETTMVLSFPLILDVIQFLRFMEKRISRFNHLNFRNHQTLKRSGV